MLPSGRGEKAALRGLSGSPGISDDIFDMDATYDLAVQNRFHSVSRPLKLLHFSTSHEIVLGWLTQVGKSHFYIREGVQKKRRFFWEISHKFLFTHPPTPGFF